MSRNDGLLKITDKKAFLSDIKEEVISTFLASFADSGEFISVYDEAFLSMELMGFWLSHFSLVSNQGSFFILVKERERLRLCLYKELCEKVLNKLVDNGILVMMWDNKKKRIFWKKKELSKNTQNV